VSAPLFVSVRLRPATDHFGTAKPEAAMITGDPAPQQARRRIKDARGRRVTQLDPIALYPLRDHRAIEARALQAIANEKKVRITAGERLALLGGACGALLVIGLFAHALITGDIRDATYAKTASLLWLCSIPWIIWLAIKRKRFGAVAAATLKHGHCPHCGYDLRLLPVDPADGATVCPECGCAWMLGEPVAAQQRGSNGRE
jgi:hypothetical protein